MEITTIVWMFVIGISVAMCVSYYNSRFLGRLVRKLLEIDATSPEAALTLDELSKPRFVPARAFPKRLLKPRTADFISHPTRSILRNRSTAEKI